MPNSLASKEAQTGAALVPKDFVHQIGRVLRSVFFQQIGSVKIDGTRLYKLARKGIEVERPPRQVMIHRIAVTEVHIPKVRFTVLCSKGTYVRALVNDAGERLGCGACMTALRRTRIGPYGLGEAMTMEQFQRRSAAPAEPAPLA